MVPAEEKLPRSYLIKQCKESLNALTHVEQTPGTAEGAERNFYNTVHGNTETCKFTKII